MDRRVAAVADLEKRLGHVFTDRGLLERALTHVSAGQGARAVPHNETLEFLGDRVLGLLAAEALIANNPDWREGELSRGQVALVSGRTCAQVARAMDVGGALRLAGSTTVQGGRDNERILGDAMEALIAAVYLDGGLEAARSVFHLAWREALAEGVNDGGVDAKTALQEWAMARGLPIPGYLEVARAGPAHAPTFTVEVCVRGHPGAFAKGASLRAAEKAAAAILLTSLRGEP